MVLLMFSGALIPKHVSYGATRETPMLALRLQSRGREKDMGAVIFSEIFPEHHQSTSACSCQGVLRHWALSYCRMDQNHRDHHFLQQIVGMQICLNAWLECYVNLVCDVWEVMQWVHFMKFFCELYHHLPELPEQLLHARWLKGDAESRKFVHYPDLSCKGAYSVHRSDPLW